MKLLLDQGLPRSAAELLRDAGIDTIHVGEIGYATASDADILRLSEVAERVGVTLDADFHAFLALSQANSPSVIRIRLQGLRAAEVASLLQVVVAPCSQDLEVGAVAMVQQGRLRVRRLPLFWTAIRSLESIRRTFAAADPLGRRSLRRKC
jgi:predicted nuclease of predicted toxin-antitoxin system